MTRAAINPPLPLVAIDWGTTNRRLFTIDAKGTCLSEESDAAGVATLGRDAIAPALAEVQHRFAGHPLLLAGMIGSSIGWHETPYMRCPVGLDALAASAIQKDRDGPFLIPGICAAPDDVPDVMRGEEVQILGAVEAGLIPPNGLICHPGTHTKWAQLKNGHIQRFRTVMTGELFALLRAHSILAPALYGDVAATAAFRQGVENGFTSRALAADLFSIRARLLLNALAADDAAAWASGVMIGNDVHFGLAEFGGDGAVGVIGDPKLTELYTAGLRAAGRDCFEVDGCTAFIAGAHGLFRRISCPK